MISHTFRWPSPAPGWVDHAVRIDDFMTPTNLMKARFTTGDLGEVSIVESGVDGVRIVHHSCVKEGDTNDDGVVNVFDLLDTLTAWGPCPIPCPADFDLSGNVDVFDLLFVLSNWG